MSKLLVFLAPTHAVDCSIIPLERGAMRVLPLLLLLRGGGSEPWPTNQEVAITVSDDRAVALASPLPARCASPRATPGNATLLAGARAARAYAAACALPAAAATPAVDECYAANLALAWDRARPLAYAIPNRSENAFPFSAERSLSDSAASRATSPHSRGLGDALTRHFVAEFARAFLAGRPLFLVAGPVVDGLCDVFACGFPLLRADARALHAALGDDGAGAENAPPAPGGACAEYSRSRWYDLAGAHTGR